MTTNVTIACVANVYTRTMTFGEVGDVEPGHTHPFDHVTCLAYGGLDIEVDGETTHYDAPAMIFIRAGAVHKLTATVAGTVAMCVHALRNGGRVEDILPPDGRPRAPYYPSPTDLTRVVDREAAHNVLLP